MIYINYIMIIILIILITYYLNHSTLTVYLPPGKKHAQLISHANLAQKLLQSKKKKQIQAKLFKLSRGASGGWLLLMIFKVASVGKRQSGKWDVYVWSPSCKGSGVATSQLGGCGATLTYRTLTLTYRGGGATLTYRGGMEQPSHIEGVEQPSHIEGGWSNPHT